MQCQGTNRVGSDLGAYHTYEFTLSGIADQYIVRDDLNPGTAGDGNPNYFEDTDILPIEVNVVSNDDGDFEYTGNVRIDAIGSGNFEFWAYASTNQKWFNINEVGWGPSGGNSLQDAGMPVMVYVVAKSAVPEGEDITVVVKDMDDGYVLDGALNDIVASETQELESGKISYL